MTLVHTILMILSRNIFILYLELSQKKSFKDEIA